MITLKIVDGEPGHYKNINDAIQYMKSNNFTNDITVYDIDSKKAYDKVEEIYNFITEYNKGKPLNEQILPTNPHGFRGIVNCLGVMAYCIGLGTYEAYLNGKRISDEYFLPLNSEYEDKCNRIYKFKSGLSKDK